MLVGVSIITIVLHAWCSCMQLVSQCANIVNNAVACAMKSVFHFCLTPGML